jgi:hypothetical protein
VVGIFPGRVVIVGLAVGGALPPPARKAAQATCDIISLVRQS